MLDITFMSKSTLLTLIVVIGLHQNPVGAYDVYKGTDSTFGCDCEPDYTTFNFKRRYFLSYMGLFTIKLSANAP